MSSNNQKLNNQLLENHFSNYIYTYNITSLIRIDLIVNHHLWVNVTPLLLFNIWSIYNLRMSFIIVLFDIHLTNTWSHTTSVLGSQPGRIDCVQSLRAKYDSGFGKHGLGLFRRTERRVTLRQDLHVGRRRVTCYAIGRVGWTRKCF